MKKALYAALAATLIPSLAPAQLVITESSPFGVSPVHYYDIPSATDTPTADGTWPSTGKPASRAASPRASSPRATPR